MLSQRRFLAVRKIKFGFDALYGTGDFLLVNYEKTKEKIGLKQIFSFVFVFFSLIALSDFVDNYFLVCYNFQIKFFKG